MTHVSRIWFKNFGPYRGDHEVKLGPGVHAIVARYEADEERSNWAGKSWLLSAVPYVLYGWHLAPSEDQVITRGEDSVVVGVELSNGASATRSRKLGKSTQLALNAPGSATCGGAQAEAELAALIGLTEADFFSTHYFAQKAASQLVTALPSVRMAKFSAWFELDLGERCIDSAGDEFDRAQELVEQLEAKRAAVAEQLEDIGRAYPGEPELGERMAAAHKAAQELAAQASEQLEQATRVQQLAADREEFKRLDAEGKELRAQRDAIEVPEIEPLQRALDEAREAAAKAKAELDQALAVVSDGFDGTCPVTRCDCPVSGKVEKQAAAIQRRADDAVGASSSANAAVGRALEPWRAADAKSRERARLDVKLSTLREQATRLGAKLKGAKAGAATGEVAELRERARAALQRSAAVAAHLEQHARAKVRLAELDAELAAARLAARAAALGGEVMRRAQRAVARQRAGRVEEGANELIASAGIPLRIELKWEQEAARGLASACTQCGAGYPRSQRVKACAQCGAARGPKTKDKPVFSLSNVSGAAEDIAGFALQLGAAAYLRARRGAPWSSALIDEPFAALDAANRKALASHLVGMLEGRFGLEQALVTAHQQDVLDAMPRRVEIVAGADGSRVA